MKFRTNSVANNRRILAALSKIAEVKTIEKEVPEKASFDAFWVLVWTLLGHVISGFDHRSLMETFVLKDKEAAKEILFRIFISVVTKIRTSTQWYGYQIYLHPVGVAKLHHQENGARSLTIILERAILSIKNGDEKALNKALEALVILIQRDDSHWWEVYVDQWSNKVGSTWASYSPEYLESPVKLEAPQFEEIGYYSEFLENWEYVLPDELYIDMKAFKRLLNEGLRLSEPERIVERKLP